MVKKAYLDQVHQVVNSTVVIIEHRGKIEDHGERIEVLEAKI